MTGLRTTGWLVLLALTVTLDAQTKRPEVLLQEALNTERIAGDVEGAITLLKPLAEHERPDIAARALVALGRLYDRQGQAQARSTFERVVRQFPNQAEAAKEARAWLAANARPTNPPVQGPLHESVWKDARVESPTPFQDGQALVYVDWVIGSGDLAVRDLKTGRNRLLTKDGGWDFYENPLPSRDGKRIAFRYGEGESFIRVANADATGARTVLRDDHAHWLADWSPDGEQLSAVRDNPDGTRTVVLLDIADGKSTQLLTLRRGYPQGSQFSPDGKYLVYAVSAQLADERNGTPAENGGVFVLPVDGRAPVALVEGPHTYDSPAWAPDGRHIVFVSTRSQDVALWSVRVSGGKAEGAPAVVEHNFRGVFPRFIADGTLFYERRETTAEAYVADFDPQTLTIGQHAPISERGIGKNREPQLSPDGARVAFVRNTEPLATVVVRTLATGEERDVTTFRPVYGAHPVQWFPDGRSLLIVQRNETRKLFQKLDLTSGRTRTLLDAPWNVWTGALSHDGSTLYYSSKDEERRIHLIRRQLESGAESVLYTSPVTPGTGLFGLSLSPDGKELAFARNTEGDGRILTILPVAGGTPRDILKSQQLFAQGSFAWTPDGKYLLFSVQPPQANQRLTAISTDTGAFTPLGVTMHSINSRMLSADGRKIVFGESKQTTDVRTLRNFLPAAATAR